MDDLRERLRRFGGVVKPPPALPVAVETGPLAALRDQLKRREERLTRQLRDSPRAEPNSQERNLTGTDPIRTLGLPAGLDAGDTELGPYLIRECQYSPSEPALRALGSDRQVLTWLSRDRRLAKLDLLDSVFLDTETTSLSGGAGVLVFLVALGRLTPDGGFTVRQYFLSTPQAERAMLAAVSADLSRVRGVVTFFGKSFDRHRLEDKFRLHGLESNFPADLHADLYHIARARFGWRLVNCKLRTLEESVLGLHRENDLPGSQAPQAYFDYLAGKPHPLDAVFEHNSLDVCSLVPLYAACAASLDEAGAEECLAAAKGAATVKDFTAVNVLSDRARRTSSDRATWIRATRILADAARARGDPGAREIYLDELATGGCPEAALELAKLAWERGGAGPRASSLLSSVREGAAKLPAGKLRDALLLGAARLRRKMETT